MTTSDFSFYLLLQVSGVSTYASGCVGTSGWIGGGCYGKRLDNTEENSDTVYVTVCVCVFTTSTCV